MHRLVFLAIAAGAVLGCDRAADKPPTDSSNQRGAVLTPAPATNAAAESLSPAASGKPVTAQLADINQCHQRVAEYKGRVVVVDVWSTSCPPCMKEFPHLVELARRWPEDVVCVSLNLDYAGLPAQTPENYLPKVNEFLSAKSADPSNMLNLLCTEPDTDALTKLDLDSMPAILVYDRSGKMAGKLTASSSGDDGLSYAGDVIPLVEKLIEK